MAKAVDVRSLVSAINGGVNNYSLQAGVREYYLY